MTPATAIRRATKAALAALLLLAGAPAFAQPCASCWTAKCPELGNYLPKCESAGKSAPAAKPTAAKPVPAKPAECTDGRETGPETEAHCCWKGQVWANGRCIGVPSACPAGLVVEAARERCAPPPCAAGQVYAQDKIHCCWPGQVWSKVRDTCVGVPAQCPANRRTDAAAQTCQLIPCPPATVRSKDGERCESCPEGHDVVGDHCALRPCPPGEARSRDGIHCETCPEGYVVSDGRCALAPCGEARVRARDGVHCVACADGYRVVDGACALAPCAAGAVRTVDGVHCTACTDGRTPVDASHCCWPGQRFTDRCAGAPRCPTGATVNGEECVVVPPGMVRVPAASFKMGEAGVEHPVRINAFAIDKFEVTRGAYAQCVAAGSCRSSGLNNAAPQHPVVNVSWDDAVQYCAWRGGARLPTEAEWELAARGTDGRLYPWGTERPTCERAIYDDCEGPKAAGTRPAGASPFGAEDMAGNVWEWVADWFSDDYFKHSPEDNPRGAAQGKERVVRGCSYDHGAGCATAVIREGRKPQTRSGEVGFRCARDLAAGGAAVIAPY